MVQICSLRNSDGHHGLWLEPYCTAICGFIAAILSLVLVFALQTWFMLCVLLSPPFLVARECLVCKNLDAHCICTACRDELQACMTFFVL